MRGLASVCEYLFNLHVEHGKLLFPLPYTVVLSPTGANAAVLTWLLMWWHIVWVLSEDPCCVVVIIDHHIYGQRWGPLPLWYADCCVKPSFFNGCLYLALVGSRQGNRAVNPRKTPSRLMRCNRGDFSQFSRWPFTGARGTLFRIFSRNLHSLKACTEFGMSCYCTDKCWRGRATFENQPNDLTLGHEHGWVLIW